MQQLRTITGVPDITFYWARHSFRNKCQMDKDSIAKFLNHVDGDHKITDIYIEKDWNIVDKVQAGVLSFSEDSINRNQTSHKKLKLRNK